MAILNKNFNEVVNFTRGTGATRINAAGLIVGVDFSSSSIAFGTGSKVFTLTADANVSRDWSIGEPVIAVSQATPLGSLTGTVTNYNPATQALTIEVATSTGTGTATNWRIGSLAVRRDAKGILQEPQSTNLFTFSNDFDSGRAGTGTYTSNTTISPDGSTNADTVATSVDRYITTTFSGTAYYSIFVSGSVPIQVGVNNAAAQRATFNPATQTFSNVGASVIATDFKQFGAFYRVMVSYPNANNRAGHIAEAGAIVWGEQITQGGHTSYIPTTTVAVTRAADVFAATAETIEAIRQGQGTIIVEAETEDNGLAQKRAVLLSGGTGSIRVAKEGTAQVMNNSVIFENNDTVLIGDNNPNGSTYPTQNDGIEYSILKPKDVSVNATSVFLTFSGVASGGLDYVLASRRYVVPGNTRANAEVRLTGDLLETAMLGSGGATFNAAHWTGSQFVLPSNYLGTVALSNGDSYRIINDPNITQPTNDATHDPVSGRIVIVGNGGYIGTSDDGGETWTQRVSGTALQIFNCSRSDLYFVATGNNAYARYSTDGLVWTQATGDIGSNFTGDMHAFGSTVVAVGQTGFITVSVDSGVTYTQATSNTTVDLNAVTYSAEADLWVACGANGTVLTAVDPTGSWTVYDNTTTPATGDTRTLQAVEYFNGLFYFPRQNRAAYTTFDPVAVSFGLTNGTCVNLLGLATNGSLLLGCGSSGGIETTLTGADNEFTSRTNNNATLNGIAFGNNRFVSVGNAANGSGYIATIDPDGTVTRRVSGFNSNAQYVRILNGVFYVGTSNPANSSSYRSVDNGITWTLVATTGTANIAATDMALGAGLYVEVGNAGRYRVSTDGVTFENFNTNPATAQNLTSIDFANNVFVSVGAAGTILTGVVSGATVTWTLRTSGTTANLRSVIYSERDERWYVAGDNGTLLYSYDAITWLPVQNASFAAIDNNGLQANPLAAAWQQGVNKIALSYKANEVKLSINGSAPATDTLATIPSITSMLIGDNFNGYIKRLTFKPIAVDPQLETQP